MQELPHEEALSSLFSFIGEHRDSIEKLARKMCHGRNDLLPEMWDVAMDHIEGSMLTYDHRCQASLKTHVLGNLRWYMWKRMKRLEDKQAEPIPQHLAVTHKDSIDDADAVQYVLSNLSEYDRALLVARHIGGMSFLQIGRAMGVCKDIARKHYAEALARAQELANV